MLTQEPRHAAAARLSAANSSARFAKRLGFPGSARPSSAPSSPARWKQSSQREGAPLNAPSLPQSCPLGLRGTQVKLARETRLQGLKRAQGQRAAGSGSPCPRPARPTPFTAPPPAAGRPAPPGTAATHAPRAPDPAPAHLSITPAGPHNPGSRGGHGRPHKRFRSPLPASALGQPQRAPLPRVREWRRPAPRGQVAVPAPEETRETPRAVGEGKGSYLRTVPAEAAERAEQGVPVAQQVSRSGGYRSALRPIVSLPGGSPRSRAREPGSSRRDTSCRRYGNGPAPRAASPGPRLRAAAPFASRAAAEPRRRGHGCRHLGGPFPAATAAPRSRRRGRARLAAAAQGSPARSLGPGRRRERAGLRTLEALRGRTASTWGPEAGPGMGGPREVRPESPRAESRGRIAWALVSDAAT